MTRSIRNDRRSHVRALLSSFLIVTMCANPIFAEKRLGTAPAKQAKPLIRDVALSANGQLQGKVLDKQGRPVGDSTVVLMDGSKELARTQSNASGDFHFAVNKGGVHQIATHDDTILCRVWTAAAAPPAAQESVFLCGSSTLVRAQCGRSSCRTSSCRRCGCNTCCEHTQSCNSCGVAAPTAPTATYEELKELAPNLPEEQFAALTRADVVIVNPEHISVAIVYNASTGMATVVAKGEDAVALQMQAVARAGGIPVVRNPPLAQALNGLQVGQAVPQELLNQIAEIMQNIAAAPATTPGTTAVYEGGGGGGGTTVGGFAPTAIIVGGLVAGMIAIPIAINNDDDDDAS